MVKTHVENFSTLLSDLVVYQPPGMLICLACAGIEGGKYFKAFRHELIGSCLMIGCTFSAGKWIGKESLRMAWTSHAMGVVASDYIGGGPHVNPAVTMSMWCLGKCSYTEGFVRVAAQIAGGLLSFPMFHALADVYELEPFGGPEFNMDDDEEHAVEAFLSEFCATTLLCFAIYILNWELHFGQFHYIIKQFLTAFTIRALIEFFPTAGPAMNPMLATTWDAFGVGSDFTLPSHFQHYFVYWIAPFLGAILASLLYAVWAGETFFGVTLPIGPLKPKSKKKVPISKVAKKMKKK